MRKLIGIALVLTAVCSAAAAKNENFLSAYNVQNLLERTALFGLLGIGVSFVIMTGGIDLSIGSMVGLVGCLLPMLLTQTLADSPVSLAVPLAIGGLLLLACLLGAVHGLLITKVGLQPFIVTLCGLLFYRGAVRWLIEPQTAGFGTGFTGLKRLTGKIALPLSGGFEVPVPFLIVLVIAVLAAIFLHRTVWGRYLLALGKNEEAARLSGVPTKRLIVLAYVICAFCSGLGGMLFILDNNSGEAASFGNFYELFAIAAAVLGGCSLRGGEGGIAGVLIGAALLQVLRNAATLAEIPTQLEYALIGAVILIGVTADEVLRRVFAKT